MSNSNIDINRFERIFKESFEARCDSVEKDVAKEVQSTIDETLCFIQSESFRQWLTNGNENDQVGFATAITTFAFAFAVGRRYGFTEWAEADNKPTGLERIEDEVEEVNRRG